MFETHPFGYFAPPNSKYLLLGSFTTKEAYDEAKKQLYDWFYGSTRNQFWPIIEEVYGLKLPDRKAKEKLFAQLNLAISDIILQCERIKNSSLDTNLSNIIFDFAGVSEILAAHQIQTIFFTSRFVETNFKRHFKDLIQKYPHIELITLPSPSPRYAAITKSQKISIYKKLLPQQEEHYNP